MFLSVNSRETFESLLLISNKSQPTYRNILLLNFKVTTHSKFGIMTCLVKNSCCLGYRICLVNIY